MKRELLFRAKRKDGKCWIYGLPTYDFEYMFNDQQLDSVDNYEINPDTLGQLVLTTPEKEQLFEDDIIEVFFEEGYDDDHTFIEEGETVVGVIEWVDFGFYLRLPDSKWVGISAIDCFKKLGNIHDNPELLPK